MIFFPGEARLVINNKVILIKLKYPIISENKCTCSESSDALCSVGHDTFSKIFPHVLERGVSA